MVNLEAFQKNEIGTEVRKQAVARETVCCCNSLPPEQDGTCFDDDEMGLARWTKFEGAYSLMLERYTMNLLGSGMAGTVNLVDSMLAKKELS